LPYDEVLSTMISTSMRAGERIYHKQAGGGGFGDPCKRDPSAVARDVKNGKVSMKAAREQYRVVIDEDTLEAKAEETRRCRESA
jgi:N-methylhydantoinase B